MKSTHGLTRIGLRLVPSLLCTALLAGCGDVEAGGPFAYGRDAPLDIRIDGSRRARGLRIIELTYASAKAGRVPALLVVPSHKGRFAGLIVQHGLPGSKQDVLGAAEELARLRAVVLAIDAPFARRGGDPISFTRRDRNEQIQLIADLRRAVDLLRSRSDVDKSRIAYLGYSYGGAMGGLLAGAEKRIAAFVLMVGDGGLVEHFTGADDSGGPVSALPPKLRRQWLAAMRPIEPLAWIRKARTPLLFLSGRHDELVPSSDATRYQSAAPEPKTIRWYDSGHFLPEAAWCDAARFLALHVQIAAEKHSNC